MGEFAKDHDRIFSDIRLHPEKLDLPRQWSRSRRIFVNSMSDLFHEDVPFDFIREVWLRMTLADHHTFQILTKRPQRLAEFVRDYAVNTEFSPHIWVGVSVEDQKAADTRIPILLDLPLGFRFLSCEPLLGPVILPEGKLDWVIAGGESGHKARHMGYDWVISLRNQCVKRSIPFFFKQWGEHHPHLGKIGKHKAGRELDGQEWNQIPGGNL
jgi:protein gp37